MDKCNTAIQQEQQFAEVVNIIVQHRSKASRTVNEETLLTAWEIGKYVSTKLKSEEWGSKVVTLLSEYIRSQRPDIKGYSRSSIYNMVMFFEEYSSEAFTTTVEKFLNSEFVQPLATQIEQDSTTKKENTAIVPSTTPLIVQPVVGQLPKILTLTTLTNHTEILCHCKSNEERLFYILYAHKEHLVKREIQRCITNDTYSSLLGSKSNMSKGLLEQIFALIDIIEKNKTNLKQTIKQTKSLTLLFTANSYHKTLTTNLPRQ